VVVGFLSIEVVFMIPKKEVDVHFNEGIKKAVLIS
jgi:hypothetical protein